MGGAEIDFCLFSFNSYLYEEFGLQASEVYHVSFPSYNFSCTCTCIIVCSPNSHRVEKKVKFSISSLPLQLAALVLYRIASESK